MAGKGDSWRKDVNWKKYRNSPIWETLEKILNASEKQTLPKKSKKEKEIN